jgi:hypothetical protein
MKGRDKRRRVKARRVKRADEPQGFLITDCRIPVVVALLSKGACRKLQASHAECENCKHKEDQ